MRQLGILTGLLLSCLPVAYAQAGDYDLVIRNGRVLDGDGNPWIRADVAIKDGRFALIGKVDGRGRREIDAAGKYVSPGWIDMLDQSGASLLRNGLAESKLRMGVTTGIAGEAGTPVAADKLPEFFATLEKGGISMNFGTSYNESQARVEVLQYAAREPNSEELARMQSIMETAMKNGALGMTTALIYPPGSYATTAELIAVAKAAAKYGGIYSTHMRGEGAELLRQVSLGQPGQRFGGHESAARQHHPGPGTSAGQWQLPAADRPLRSRQARDHARGRCSKINFLACYANASGEPRIHQRGNVGRCRDLRSRSYSGPVHL